MPQAGAFGSAAPGPAEGPRRPGGFSGQRRQRKTRLSVHIFDAVARALITAGGLGVVVMFGAIVAYLLWVAIPLFGSASVEAHVDAQLPPAAGEAQPDGAAPVALGVDENLIAGWLLDSAGRFSTYHLAGGAQVSSELVSDLPMTAFAERRGSLAVARADGTVQLGSVGFETVFAPQVPPEAASLRHGQTVAVAGGVAEQARGRIRITRPQLSLGEPVEVADGAPSPVRRMDYLRDGDLEALVAILDDGRLVFGIIRKQRNMMTGAVTSRVVKHELPRSTAAPDEQPTAILMGRNARSVFLVYPSGHLTRYDTADPARSVIAEEMDLTADTGARVTAASMLMGNLTLIIGDADGRVSGWFAAPYPDDATSRERSATTDGLRMVRAHQFTDGSAAVTRIAISNRDRQFLTTDAEGNVTLQHMTSEAVQARLQPFDGEPVPQLALSPKNDALVVLSEDRRLVVYGVDNPHPDASFRSLFLPVHYEGRAAPEHFYQSSAGSDASELKYGLVPLVFGTIKATLYAMLFAVPLAILAAIYSAEFMQPQVRTVVKPLVELMAGLPSVVLGFIAALVLAPFVENVVPAVLLIFVAVPVGVMIFGFLWQLLPPNFTRSVPGWVPFLLMGLAVIGMVGLAFLLGPVMERLLFWGDFRAWLDRRVGTGPLGATPGWMLLLTPLCAIAIVMIFNLHLRHRIPLFDGRRRSRTQLAAADLVRFLVITVLSIGAAALAGAVLSLLGLDLRGGVVGTYMQRNALTVGMVMGFAIIPIIYTVSEDALSSVPNSLRSAALGAGATPWQTAVRVVLPVAASGIFSACMIGFGRAAGETMIVLMAAGNTPVMDWNLFNGLRTLSANIAVEMPEAAVDSTHFRILYLSALVLFAITFAVNTVAEVVRMRFRRRAFQL